MKVSWETYRPGELAMWHSGSAYMSWPPDGEREMGDPLESAKLKSDSIVLIVARPHYHGAIVLFHNRLWWCPLAALEGEPSGSKR